MGTDQDANPVASDLALPLPLTQRMRDQSRELHDKSDKLVNLKLALALTSKPLYAEAISLFWPIYRELEVILEKHREHAQLRLLYPLLPQLRRASFFEQDMISLLGSKSSADLVMARRISMRDGQDQFSPPELQEYINHLRMLSEKDPLLLLPYFYSMYGAIFAGGAIIKRMVKRAFSLKNDEGVEMFNVSFQDSDFKNVTEFRNEMKRRLDEVMEISEDDKDRIVQESPQVFVRNNALVATAQDSDVFKEVWSKCRNYLLVIPTVAVVVVGMWMMRDKAKS
jgi:heme oxygenase